MEKEGYHFRDKEPEPEKTWEEKYGDEASKKKIEELEKNKENDEYAHLYENDEPYYKGQR